MFPYTVKATADGWTLTPTLIEADGSQAFFTSALNAMAYAERCNDDLAEEMTVFGPPADDLDCGGSHANPCSPSCLVCH